MSDWREMQQVPSPRSARGRDSYPSPQTPSTPYVVQGGPVSDRDGSAFTPVTTISNTSTKEQSHRFAGLGVGVASVFAEHILSHPCIVLRRQCQVHKDTQWYHLTPVTLFPVIFNLQRHQSVTTLFKGIGSTFLVKGVGVAAEAVISEFTPLPREISRHSPFRKVGEHLLMKIMSSMVTTPFYAASLVETVQSEIASERPGVLDCLKEGGNRVFGWSVAPTTTILPIWVLLGPTIFHGVSHYIISSLAKYTVQVSMRAEMLEAKDHNTLDTDKSLYETYYPELIATFTGNLLADTVLYPLETILHRLFIQGTRTIIDDTDSGIGVQPIVSKYDNLVDCFRQIIHDEGFAGLYKGFGALLLQYALHVVILKLTRSMFEFLSRETPTSSRRLSMSEYAFNQNQEVIDRRALGDMGMDRIPTPGVPGFSPGGSRRMSPASTPRSTRTDSYRRYPEF